MSAEAIFRALGGARQGNGYVVRCPVPSHGQGRGDRHPSLSLRDSDDRLLVHCHSGCDAREVLQELRRRGLLEEGGRRREILDRNRSSQKEGGAKTPTPSLNALSIWHEARDPRGTIAERYLAGRGLSLPDEVAGSALRFHPSCWFGDRRVLAMVALFRHIITDESMAIHRTALTAGGGKIGRKMFGPVAGAAIKLDADDTVTGGLHIGEGVETCLAARQIGFRPVWALGSSGRIGTFPVLPGIEALSILAEKGKASADAVQTCGDRWSGAGREVFVVDPVVGSDINDALREASR